MRQTSSSSGHRMMSSNEREVPGLIPQTNSSEELMPHGGTSSDSEGGGSSSCIESGKVSTPSLVVESGPISRIEMFTVFVLCFVNLINYMDRLTIAGKCRVKIEIAVGRGDSKECSGRWLWLHSPCVTEKRVASEFLLYHLTVAPLS